MDSMMNDLNSPHSMGTTIIGVTYDGGVILGADSRTSTGLYVANRASDKITQLTDNVYLCRSGSVQQQHLSSLFYHISVCLLSWLCFRVFLINLFTYGYNYIFVYF
ncbi:putative proteasome endopeptidase complex [Helianthus debilis subsp. tardiflorus]